MFVALPATVFAHDPYETTMGAWLRPRQLELHITLNAHIVEKLLDKAGLPAGDLSVGGNFEAARPAVARLAAGWFPISAGGHLLVAQQTNVTHGVEDHVEIALIFPRPAKGAIRFEAAHLKQLPHDEPYGAPLTVLDLANNVVLGQKSLTAADSVFETECPDVPRSSPPAAPPKSGSANASPPSTHGTPAKP